jgi:hypothetical protein
MSKPVTGRTRVGQRRERRPNGDLYIYERVTAKMNGPERPIPSVKSVAGN